MRRQHVGSRQHGGGVGSAAAVAAEQLQRGGGSVAVVAVQRQCGGGRQRGGGVGSLAAAAPAACWWQRRKHAGGGRLGGCGRSLAHHGISGGSRAAGAALTLRATMVVTKTPAATAMVGALPTINNQLKAAAAMATETVMSTTIETYATGIAVAVWQQRSVGGSGSTAAAVHQQCGDGGQQHGSGGQPNGGACWW